MLISTADFEPGFFGRQLVRFHQFADSVRLDVMPGGGLAVGTDNPDMFQEAAGLLEMTMEIGHSLTDANTGASSK
jgi:hypothetical protein